MNEQEIDAMTRIIYSETIHPTTTASGKLAPGPAQKRFTLGWDNALKKAEALYAAGYRLQAEPTSLIDAEALYEKRLQEWREANGPIGISRDNESGFDAGWDAAIAATTSHRTQPTPVSATTVEKHGCVTHDRVFRDDCIWCATTQSQWLAATAHE